MVSLLFIIENLYISEYRDVETHIFNVLHVTLSWYIYGYANYSNIETREAERSGYETVMNQIPRRQ